MEHVVDVMVPVDSTNTEVVLESTKRVHEKLRSAMKTGTAVLTHGAITDNDDVETVECDSKHSRKTLETRRKSSNRSGYRNGRR